MAKSFKEAFLSSQKSAIEAEIVRMLEDIKAQHKQQIDALTAGLKGSASLFQEVSHENKELKSENKDLLREVKAMQAELEETKAFNESLSHNDAEYKIMIAEERAKFKALERAYVVMTMEHSNLQETMVAAMQRERVQRAIIFALRAKKN